MSLSLISLKRKVKTMNKRNNQSIAKRTGRQGRAADLELGRTWLQIRRIVGHSHWKRYYAAKFGSCGIPLRRAQMFMGMARKAEAKPTFRY